LLSRQLRTQIRALARQMEPYARKLERSFMAEMRKLGWSAIQRQTLARITLGTAARMLAGRGPLAAFFEHLEYNGRRLAKLDLGRGAVVEALQSYDRLLARELRHFEPEEAARLQWVSGQLNFLIALTVNDAFYQVREAETKAFYELFQAELESAGQRQLLERSLGTLVRFCQADAGRLFLFHREKQSWLVLGAPGAVELCPAADAQAMLNKLALPRHIRGGAASQRLLLDPAWRGRYPSCWSVPLISVAGVTGAMQFGFRKTYAWLPRELGMLSGAAERCLLGSEKLRLAEDLAAREEQVRELASHMIEVEERERRRISRELHDEAGQLLLCLPLQLDMIERSVPDAPARFSEGLSDAREMVGRAVVEIRRLISDLSPAVLEQLGLGAAVRQLVNRFRTLQGVQVRLHLPRLEALDKRTELVVYRLVQECCSNIARHSSASNVIISLSTADKSLRLCVEDDGVGFRVEEALVRRESFGLAGMRERVALFGGQFEVQSRPGHGSSIGIVLPLPDQPASERAVRQAG
jgi:signal transduction histidine kinase